MKKSNTKRALGMSLISLLACGVMFAGSTYAWFTDEVVASGNKIETGTLKVDLEVLEGTSWKSLRDSSEAVFSGGLWEPGYTDYAVFKIENEGNLAVKWNLKAVKVGADSKNLAKVIDVYAIVSDDELANPTSLKETGYEKVGTLADVLAKGTLLEGKFDANKTGAAKYLGIMLHMQEEAGNEYQGATDVEFDIKLNAYQLAQEEDGFGNSNYDDAATIKNEAQLIAALKNGGTIELGAPVALDEVVEISADTVINLNGYDLDASACASRPFSMANGADLTINATNSEIKAGNYGLVNITNGETKVVLNGGSYTSNMDNGSFVKPRGSAKVDIELNNVKFADTSDDSYIMDASSYGGNELVVTINGGDYSCAKGIAGHNADFTVKGATIETSLFSFEAGLGSTLLIEDSEISVLTNTENPAAPSACVALSDTSGVNPSSATIKNSVLNSEYHVFANYSGHNTLTYTDCEINHSGDAAQLMIYDNPVGSSLVVNGMEAASVETPAALEAALAAGKYVELGANVVTSDFLSQNGGVFNGNGNTIDASSKATDTKALCSITTTGGTIKNVKVVGGRRGIGSGSTGTVIATEDLIIDNVVVDAVVYGINHGGNGHALKVSNSVLNGWNSYEGCSIAEFTNCEFVYGRSTYCYLRTYDDTTFVNCSFAKGFKIAGNYADWVANGSTPLNITFENCYYNGVKITSANFAELLLNASDDDAKVISQSNLVIK